MSKTLRMTTGLGLALALAGPAGATEPAHPALAGLAHCGESPDPAARASCYDAAFGALNQAVKSGDVVIIQRQEAKAAQRSAFGLNLPALNIFDRAGPDAAPLDNVVSEVKSAREDEFGKWVVELADGAVWRQLDDEVLAPPPRPGARVEIRRGGLGSYFMKIGNHRGVRARRSQ